MARKRTPKQTEKPTVTLAELPRDAEELTTEEAEATKGGWSIFLQPLSQAAKEPKGDFQRFGEKENTGDFKRFD